MEETREEEIKREAKAGEELKSLRKDTDGTAKAVSEIKDKCSELTHKKADKEELIALERATNGKIDRLAHTIADDLEKRLKDDQEDFHKDVRLEVKEAIRETLKELLPGSVKDELIQIRTEEAEVKAAQEQAEEDEKKAKREKLKSQLAVWAGIISLVTGIIFMVYAAMGQPAPRQVTNASNTVNSLVDTIKP